MVVSSICVRLEFEWETIGQIARLHNSGLNTCREFVNLVASESVIDN